MDDTQDIYAPLRQTLLTHALPHIAYEGWTKSVIARAAQEADIDADMLPLILPRGAIDLIIAFSKNGDAMMQDNLARFDKDTMKIRSRITEAVWERLKVDEPYAEAIRHIYAVFARPHHALDATQLVWTSVDIIWRWAGDTSTDYNFYTKRLILGNVLMATRLAWVGDASTDYADTRAFLERRIDNVMQFETFKVNMRAHCANIKPYLPDPVDFLTRLRFGKMR